MLTNTLIESLSKVIEKGDLLTEDAHLQCYSADALTPYRAFRAAPSLRRMADVVVIPRSTQQVVDVVKVASAQGVPVVPYGGGTGVMGAALPVQGGVVIDLKGLNKVLDINPVDRTVLVDAGVVLEDLVNALSGHGMILGHDPWSVPIATVAGAISTNGVGYCAATYGPMGEQVLGLEVVLPTGQVVTTRPLPKYSSGPNLNHLFIGTEGVFGIITKASLRVFHRPEKQIFSTVGFSSFDEGFQAVSELFALGLRPTLVDLTEEPGENVHLYMVHQGYVEGVEAQYARALKVCCSFGGVDLGPEETSDHWETRHQTAERYRRDMLDQPRSVRWQRRGGRGFDYLHVALPVSRVLEYRQQCDVLLAKVGIKVAEYSIWAEPELFSMLLVPSEGAPEHSTDHLADAVDQVLTLAQDMGGIMEYCHGVGVKLGHLLSREMGAGYDLAKVLKHSIDPTNIMNPGKLF